jgi:5-methylcytosine-specific restriction endonuclease McrA
MVFVRSKNKKKLMPCSEKRAKLLLARGRARIHKMVPFTIRLTDRTNGKVQPLELKIDPGSKKTGIAIIRKTENTVHVISLIELEHRGASISEDLTQRKGYRKRRRSANLRYRAPRFNNRKRKKGWLPPSLQHRVDSTMSCVNRLQKLLPIVGISQELVRFDMQLIENPEISGIEYQHGTLAGYELREYVFAKLGRQCVYCDTKIGPFNLDHLISKAHGGSNRVSNLAPACISCNERKGSQNIREFLAHDLTRADNILKRAKAPLKDAAAVNATRWALFGVLSETGIPVSVGTGGRTKWNRKCYKIEKTHALDAVCVGNMDDILAVSGIKQPTLEIKCMGRGSYQRTRVTKSGFPRGYLMRKKSIHGFTTGDLVSATVPKGKKTGTYRGRVAIRATGSFNIQTVTNVVQGISWKHCRLLQRNDGYRYNLRLVSGMNAEVSAFKASS